MPCKLGASTTKQVQNTQNTGFIHPKISIQNKKSPESCYELDASNQGLSNLDLTNQKRGQAVQLILQKKIKLQKQKHEQVRSAV